MGFRDLAYWENGNFYTLSLFFENTDCLMDPVFSQHEVIFFVNLLRNAKLAQDLFWLSRRDASS